MEPKPEESIPSEPERGPSDVESDDLETTIGGRAQPTYTAPPVQVVDDK